MNKISNRTKIVIIMVVVAIGLFILNTVSKGNEKKAINTDKYISLYEENIPTIYESLGAKTINSQSEGYDSKGKYLELKYRDLTILDIASYAEYLGNLGYYLTSSDEDSAVLAINSKDKDKIITISVEYTEAETTIKYTKGVGTLTKK